MWTYLGARKSEKRNDLSIWTTVVEERDGSGRIDFEVGDRDEATFLRLPERYETDAYGVYGDAADQQACGWEVRRGELDVNAAREVESVSASDKGWRKEH